MHRKDRGSSPNLHHQQAVWEGGQRNVSQEQSLQFASCYRVSEWRWVIWSDETKIEPLGDKHQRLVWHRQTERAIQEELLKPTVKCGGGSLMLWSFLSPFSGKPWTFCSDTWRQLRQILCDNLTASDRRIRTYFKAERRRDTFKIYTKIVLLNKRFFPALADV